MELITYYVCTAAAQVSTGTAHHPHGGDLKAEEPHVDGIYGIAGMLN